jgi:hypothetical protein
MCCTAMKKVVNVGGMALFIVDMADLDSDVTGSGDRKWWPEVVSIIDIMRSRSLDMMVEIAIGW